MGIQSQLQKLAWKCTIQIMNNSIFKKKLWTINFYFRNPVVDLTAEEDSAPSTPRRGRPAPWSGPRASPASTGDPSSPPASPATSSNAETTDFTPRPPFRPLAQAQICTICLEPLDSAPIEALLCGHIFHLSCVERWIRRTPTCLLEIRRMNFIRYRNENISVI